MVPLLACGFVLYSSDHYDSIREKVRIFLTGYDVENISQMVKAITHHIAELECANQYESQLTLSMMLHHIATTCTQGGFFSHILFKNIIAVKEKVAECNFMSKQDGNNRMKKNRVDPKSELEEDYTTLLKDNLWTPARLPVDRTKASLNQVSSPVTCQPSASNVNQLTAQVLALLKNSIPSKSSHKKTRENSPCNICGGMGHWAPECPERKPNQKNISSKKGSQVWRRPGHLATLFPPKQACLWTDVISNL
jgi:hypothetical protein